jgi:MacB-like periplasmic core domain
MRTVNKLKLRLRSLFQREAVNHELDDELRLHIDHQIEQNIAAGMSPDEARYAALREFGGLDQIREECNDMRNVNWLQDFVQDVRYGVRVLAKSPGFAAIAVLTLALGIGANTAIFSLIDSALLRMLPISNPQNLLLLRWTARTSPNHLDESSYGDCPERQVKTGAGNCVFSEPLFHEIQAANLFSQLTAFSGGGGLDLTGNGAATTVDNAEYVSGSYFQTLGVRPETGRLISSADDSLSASPVTVLSYAYWRAQFSGSPSAIGKTIYLNRVPFTIIGVAEPRFDALSPGRFIQMWLPLSAQRQTEIPWDNRDADPNYFWLVIVGRLNPGVQRNRC